ncbi:MAG: hypothetical protein ABSB35_37910 [Bryobacteraceae bacterium]
MSLNDEQRQIADEPPPILGTWPRVYCFVLAYLAVVIFLFYVFTRMLAP